MADEPAATKRVELVDQGDPSAGGLPGYIGIGLIGGIILGFGPLRDAVGGNGPFEDAMIRFLACLLVCVGAASLLGRLLDSAPPPEDDDDDEGEDPSPHVPGVTDPEPIATSETPATDESPTR